MENVPKGSDQKVEGERVNARIVSVLDCNAGTKIMGKKRDKVLIVTLGRDDASIEKLAFVLPEAKRILYRIAFALGREQHPFGPATEQELLNRWCHRHSVGRSELNVEGNEQKYLDNLRDEFKDAREYFLQQFDALSRSLHRKNSNIANPENLLKRIRRLVLMAFDIGRPDT